MPIFLSQMLQDVELTAKPWHLTWLKESNQLKGMYLGKLHSGQEQG